MWGPIKQFQRSKFSQCVLFPPPIANQSQCVLGTRGWHLWTVRCFACGSPSHTFFSHSLSRPSASMPTYSSATRPALPTYLEGEYAVVKPGGSLTRQARRSFQYLGGEPRKLTPPIRWGGNTNTFFFVVSRFFLSVFFFPVNFPLNPAMISSIWKNSTVRNHCSMRPNLLSIFFLHF